MDSNPERTFEARLANIGAAVAFVESTCAAHRIGRQDALRLAFIVEELFTNTVTHGHGGDCDAPVTLGLHFDAGEARLEYADAAPAHNPLEHLQGEPAGLTTSVTLRPVGGLGTYLIGHLIETGRYRREGERNLLSLSLPLEG